MGLFSWLSGADRLEDARRVLLEGADEKIRAGVDEFAVEVRGVDFALNGNKVDERLIEYVSQGLDERGLVLLGVDYSPDQHIAWIRVKKAGNVDNTVSTETEDQESHLRMKDGRKFPLEMSPDRAKKILADAAEAGEEFVTFPLKDGLANVQFLAAVDGIGSGYALQITASDT